MTSDVDVTPTGEADRAADLVFARSVDAAGGAALLVLLATVLADPLHVNRDCGALLFASRMLLEGRLPFVDYYDLNPPLIDYLLTVPALAARVVPLPLPLVFNLMVVALVGLSWRLTRRALRGSGLTSESTASVVALTPLALSIVSRDDAWAAWSSGSASTCSSCWPCRTWSPGGGGGRAGPQGWPSRWASARRPGSSPH